MLWTVCSIAEFIPCKMGPGMSDGRYGICVSGLLTGSGADQAESGELCLF